MHAGGYGNFDPSIFIREGKGSRVWDENGRGYVVHPIGPGPMLLGHGHPKAQMSLAPTRMVNFRQAGSYSAGIPRGGAR